MIDSGTKLFRSRFNINERKIVDCPYYKGVPVFAKFVLPGDVWKINTESFVRFQPLLSPTLTPNQGRIRFFYVPIRLVEPDTELIITGSKDGYFNKDVDIPSFESWKHVENGNTTVEKGSVLEIMTGLPPGTYSADVFDEESAPADYWRKAYFRIWWDYYRDENLQANSFGGDFDTFLSAQKGYNYPSLFDVCLPHDYFTSALPWQLKGVAPAIDISGQVPLSFPTMQSQETAAAYSGALFGTSSGGGGFSIVPGNSGGVSNAMEEVAKGFESYLESGVGTLSGISFTMSDLRDLSAQTRVFERLARCGSRYTEYLRANFGTAPADGTLQRAQYLGGVKFPIVTTEIPQTAQAENSSGDATPVGTLRGKGISASAGSISSAKFNEFGVIIGIADFRPSVQYTQGLPREYTYKRRFDFFNPSFQHLSEQEVRNSEIYYADDGDNDKTFGFQLMYQELRTGKTSIVGDMRDTLKFWHQGIEFGSRPSLNGTFISGKTYDTSFKRVFEVVENSVNPIIADFGFHCEVHRPMVRYGTPGLVDHL